VRLWECTLTAKLRFGGGRVSAGKAIVVVSRRGDRVSLAGAFPKRFANFGNEMKRRKAEGRKRNGGAGFAVAVWIRAGHHFSRLKLTEIALFLRATP
jgi:hypothetical protein